MVTFTGHFSGAPETRPPLYDAEVGDSREEAKQERVRRCYGEETRDAEVPASAGTASSRLVTCVVY